MKRILWFILLLFVTGCKVLQPTGNRPEKQPVSSEQMEPGEIPISITDSLQVVENVPVDTLAAKTDSLISAIDRLDSLTANVAAGDSLTTDSLAFPGDSLILPNDSLSAITDSVPRKKGALEAPVVYSAKDSIVWTAGNMAYLFGEANVKYQAIELKAENIRMVMDSSVIYASLGIDSLGNEFGHPVFSPDGSQSIESKEMKYNFKTEIGLAKESVSQQGEGYIIAGVTKKMVDGMMNMQGGKYTTCDELDHPHFYIQLSKAKVRPGKNVVSGPAWLVIEDVPLPVAFPFFFFPFTDTYSSGFLMPTYGDEINRGFFLRNGGWYFALSDYFDFSLTGEIYTKGSWGLSGQSSYRKRYKYSGSFAMSYLTTVTGEKGLDDFQKRKDFSVKLSHSQDPKANPYRTISASVDYSSSSYDRNQLNTLYTSAATQNNKGSSVSLSQRFPNSPFSLSASMNINQRSQDSSVSVTLPDMTITMTRIYPFKRKNAIGKEHFWDKISVNYNAQIRNSVSSIKEDQLFKSNIIKDWKNGISHKADVNATYSIFDVINISPNFSYTERWYTQRVEQSYDVKAKRMMPSDTIYGFNRVYNYSGSVSASTTLYGMYTPWKIFQKYVKAIRHRMDPSISFSATPDFGDQKYGFYTNYHFINGLNTFPGGMPDTITSVYSPYKDGLFGVPGTGKSGSISLSLDNNIEAKIPDANEESGERKISIIDKLSGSISYNIAKDTMRWSDLNTSMRFKLSKSYTLNLNMMFDTYLWEYDERRGAHQVNKTRFANGSGLGRIGRLKSTGTSYSYTFNNDSFKKWFGGKDVSKKSKNGRTDDDDLMDDEFDPDNPAESRDRRTEMDTEKQGSMFSKKKQKTGDYDEDGYYNAAIQWSLSVNYNLAMAYNLRKFNIQKKEYEYQFTHGLSFNGSLQPTKNWRLTFNATYDFKLKKIPYATCNISRSMHCWNMTASMMPFGPMKSYSFSISANAAMLKDLKYDQRSSPYNSMKWY